MMDVQPRPAIRPLGSLAMRFLPLLLLIRRGPARALLERRAALRVKLRDHFQAEKEVKRALEKEAVQFWEIIEGALTRMGHAYVPMQDHQSASGANKGKVQRIRVERCYTTPEIIYYKILTRRRTLFGTKNALPYHVFLGDIIQEDRLRELSWACHRVVSSVHEDPRFGVWLRVHRLEGVGGLPTKVQFGAMLEHYPEDMTAGTLVLGVGAHRKIHSVDLAHHPHVLIAGSTGSGKSNMVNQMIAGLMMFCDPRALQFVLIDLKRMEFKLFRRSAHLNRPVISDAEQAIEALSALVDEIEYRAKLMENTDVKEIAGWNEKYPDRALPRLICIIDEFAELRLASDKKISDEAARLVNRACNLGRAVGVHIWICTQRPARAVLGNEVKINMPLILAGRTMSTAQSIVILDNGHAADLPQVPGRMLYQSGSNEFEIQTPYISNEDIKQAVRVSQGRAMGVITLEGVEPVIVRDKLIVLVAEQGGKLSVDLVDELLCEYAITRKMYRTFCQELIKAGRVEALGNVYVVSKKGNAYRLTVEAQPMPQTEPELEQAPVMEATPYPFEFKLLPAYLRPPTPTEPVEVEAPSEIAETPQVEVEAQSTPEPYTIQIHAVKVEKLPDQVFDEFIMAKCSVKSDAKILAQEIYEAYTDYCQSEEVPMISQRNFGMGLKQRGFTSQRTTGGRFIWHGLTLVQPEEATSEVSEVSEADEASSELLEPFAA